MKPNGFIIKEYDIETIEVRPMQPQLATSVFRAVADPTRRAILALLIDGELTVGEVADQFDMTRPAVAKHLRVLGEGDLIRVEARGRMRVNRLNPAPLQAMTDWLSIFDRFWEDRLQTLKQEVERDR
jgi:DNA-binding transcriptional ArsR family regulator